MFEGGFLKESESRGGEQKLANIDGSKSKLETVPVYK